jgi:signal transduction histidine kinase
LEALTNVERHAQARHCWIRLSVADQFYIEVTDDGVGPAADGRAGVGIASMRERATELGGVCDIAPRPQGGTRVLASLPLNTGAPDIELAEPPLHFAERQIEAA